MFQWQLPALPLSTAESASAKFVLIHVCILAEEWHFWSGKKIENKLSITSMLMEPKFPHRKLVIDKRMPPNESHSTVTRGHLLRPIHPPVLRFSLETSIEKHRKKIYRKNTVYSKCATVVLGLSNAHKFNEISMNTWTHNFSLRKSAKTILPLTDRE